MANPNSPFGLRPICDRSGRPYNGAARAYVVPASDGTALYIGDPVQLGGASENGVATIVRANAGSSNYILGVVVGFEIDNNIRLNGYRAASTRAVALIADDPELLFEIQEDSASENVLAAEVGLNANLAAGSGSSVTKRSGFTLDSDTAAATATLQLKIEGIVNDHQNEIEDTSAYKRILVSINLHQRRNTTGI